MLEKHFSEIHWKFLARSADIICNAIAIDWYHEGLLILFTVKSMLMIQPFFFNFLAGSFPTSYLIAWKVCTCLLNLWMLSLYV